MTKKIHALAPMLDALNIKQSVTFDEANMLFADVLKASWDTPPAFEVSGNQWTAIVNLAVARFGSRYGINELEAQQQAEPVAWMDREGDLYKMPEIENWSPPHTMLYTTPPQRKWQDLTDEDLEFWTGELGQGELGRGVIRAVADELKEKNNG